jgi:hypothetical protein
MAKGETTVTNMDRMRAFYLAYSIFPQAVGKLEESPIFNTHWGHNRATKKIMILE